MSQAYIYAMIFHSIISLSFAEGTERILRYTSLSYLQRTCITIMSCWCNVCRGLNIERMLSSHSWRGACLISLHFSAYLIRLSYQESQKATESLPGFFSLFSFFLASWLVLRRLYMFGKWWRAIFQQYSNSAAVSFSCIIENTNSSETNNCNSCKIIRVILAKHPSLR